MHFESNDRERRLLRLFYVSVAIKGLNAILETVIGALLLGTDLVNDIALTLVKSELIQDPHDFIATRIQAFFTGDPHAQTAAGLYLLSHGLVKSALVVGLLRRKMWAYPASIAVLSLFILYQLLSMYVHFSLTLLLLTLFDTFVIWLIWHEYHRVRQDTPHS